LIEKNASARFFEYYEHMISTKYSLSYISTEEIESHIYTMEENLENYRKGASVAYEKEIDRVIAQKLAHENREQSIRQHAYANPWVNRSF
jgi:hypothetical protein